MGEPYQNARARNVSPRFMPGQQGPYNDPIGAEDYRGPGIAPTNRPPRKPEFGVADPAALRQGIASLYGGRLTPEQERGIGLIMKYGAKLPTSHLAYALATADHETGQFQFREENGRGKGRPYGEPDGNGNVYYGRGDAMITWKKNYEEFDKILGMEGALVSNPDLAKDPDIGARILVHGLTRAQGFTGRGTPFFLGDQEIADEGQFINARKAVNGLDRAEKIAKRAMAFQDVRAESGYKRAAED